MKQMLLKKLALTLGATLLGVMSASAITPFQRDAKTKVARAPQASVMWEENFAKFTAGSEAAPDKTDIRIPDTYTIDQAWTQQPGWTGNCAWQAGGACYLGSYDDEYYGKQYGFISTPQALLFGEVTITVDAKLPASHVAVDGDELELDVALCDDYYGPTDRKQFVLTKEWQTFTFKTDKASFDVPAYIQFTCYDAEILIDNIKVERAITKIAAPYAHDAINNSATSFTASWEPTDDAEDYLLSVYYKDMPANAIPEAEVCLDFENTAATADGLSGLPEGWAGSADISTEAGTFSSGKQALLFGEVGQYILSPVMPAPISSVSFWCKPSTMESESWMSSSLLSVEVFADNEWVSLGSLSNYYLPDGDVWEMTLPVLPEYATQLRIKYIQKGEREVKYAIDNLTIKYASQPVPFELFTDKVVKGTSYTVDSYDSSKEHFYYVIARGGDLMSDKSNVVWVDGLVGVTPELGEPTDVNESGFTIGWTNFVNADKYKLNLDKIIYATEDNQAIVLLDENFDGVTAPGATFESPTTSYYNEAYLAEKGFAATDWICQLPAFVDGMAGAQQANYWSGKAGLVVSPRISLNNGDGSFTVDFAAYMFDPSDEMFVVLLKEYTDNQAIVGIPVPYNKGSFGRLDYTLNFPEVNAETKESYKDVKVAFMSKLGKPFFIDRVKVSQRFATGEKATAPCATIFTEKPSYTFTDLAKADAYAVSVMASAEKDFRPYVSNWSATKVVSLNASVADIVSNSSVVICTKGSDVLVTTPVATDVEIYNIQGQQLAKVPVEAGTSTINCSGLSGQLLIVRAAGKAIKCKL